MIDAQAHRGPTTGASGRMSVARWGIAAFRSLTCPKRAANRCPMGADGGVLITFNGEIYNFQQLRRELESLGHRFRTRTDTEAIIYAYEQWGVDCLTKLRGMFAFGIWDRRRRRLFLARDRVGKKPLFYAQFGDRFLFASELQGILADKDVPREVDPRAIDAYLSYGYVPAPRTAFKGVYKLPPAHYLTLDLKQTGFEKRHRALLVARLRTQAPHQRRRGLRSLAREDDRGGAAADDQRRSARRVSVGRD